VITDALVLRVIDDLHGDELRAVGHHVEVSSDRLVLGQNLGQDHTLATPGLVLKHLDSVSSEKVKKRLFKVPF
jgi:hypothetical protein